MSDDTKQRIRELNDKLRKAGEDMADRGDSVCVAAELAEI